MNKSKVACICTSAGGDTYCQIS